MSTFKTDDANYGWLFFKDSFWHWSMTVPEGAVEARQATDWEKFFFNSFGNRSDKFLAFLSPVL